MKEEEIVNNSNVKNIINILNSNKKVIDNKETFAISSLIGLMLSLNYDLE